MGSFGGQVASNVVRHPTNQQIGRNNLYGWPQQGYPYWTWQVPAGDTERLRFALELILEGDLTHDAVKKIAKKALRK